MLLYFCDVLREMNLIALISIVSVLLLQIISCAICVINPTYVVLILFHIHIFLLL